MIEIVISVCMLQQPTTCKDVTLNFLANSISQRQCMINGQYEISKWLSVHPKWSVRKWRCGVAKQVAKA